MKLIARTESGYLCEVTNAEISKLSEDGNYGFGTEISILKIAKTLQLLRGLDQDRLKYAINRTQDILDTFDEIRTAIESLTLIDTLQKDYNA